MQGASPLASPGAEPERRLLALPLWYPAGGVPPALPARRALAVPCGGLPSLSPAYPAFSFLFRPHPPDPLPPRGRGRILVFLCKGLRPLHPPGLNPGDTGAESEPRARRGAAIPVACRP